MINNYLDVVCFSEFICFFRISLCGIVQLQDLFYYFKLITTIATSFVWSAHSNVNEVFNSAISGIEVNLFFFFVQILKKKVSQLVIENENAPLCHPILRQFRGMFFALIETEKSYAFIFYVKKEENIFKYTLVQH